MTNLTVGSQTSVVSGVRGTVTIADQSGNIYLYAVVKNFTVKWGNKQEEEYVSGTDIPIIVTQGYHGEAELEKLYSTDNTQNDQVAKFLNPVNGYVSSVGMTWGGIDTALGTRSFACTSAFPKEYQWSLPGEKTILDKITFVFGARPTFT